LTGLTVGHAVIIKSGVVVAGILGVVVRDEYIVIANNGVVVPVPVIVTEPVTVILDVIVFVGTSDADNDPDNVAGTEGVTESESVMEGVGALLEVTDIVLVTVEEAVTDRVSDGVAGIDGVNVPLTDAASNPTLISIPQAWGSVSVAE
jgi:hypothetical protein